MRGKFATAVLSVLTITTITITGCGSSFPELTDEEYDQTVQYAAGLLMRYSNNAVANFPLISLPSYLVSSSNQNSTPLS